MNSKSNVRRKEQPKQRSTRPSMPVSSVPQTPDSLPPRQTGQTAREIKQAGAQAEEFPDKEHQEFRWDIVGDKKRNPLFVVVSHRKKKLRFAIATDEPGGWAIAGQVFGIDAETDAIAQKMSERLFKEHRDELIGLPITPKRDTVTD